MSEDIAGYKDRRIILFIIGGLLLVGGIAVGFFGPLEMYCFYLFSEGGRFHYEGFGFGSFMFGNIAAPIIGYYLIGAVCVPLGYGHVTARRWARKLTLTLLWFWGIFGIPLIVVFLFTLFSSKDLSIVGGLIALVMAGLAYFVAPWLLMRFYRSRDVRLTFETRDPKPSWIDDLPQPVLVLGALLLFYIVVLHIPIFFNGIFPLFGLLLTGIEGISMIDVSIFCLAGLTWGTLKLKPWAWWGALVYVSLLTVSVIVTFSQYTLLDILARLRFPPTETEFLDGLPFHGFHLALTLGVPLLITLGLLIFSRRYFNRSPSHPSAKA
jgi:MFS family permease